MGTDMPAGNGNSNITEVASALTAVIGVFAALAVTGVIGQAQRNHGFTLVGALVLVLIGAVLWLVAAALVDPESHRNAVTVLKSSAIALLAIGLLGGIIAIWRTQQDRERPSVTSVFDPKSRVIAVTANAHGLRTDSRLVVVVSAYKGTPDDPNALNKAATLYYAVVGPEADGDVTHTASVPLPASYTLVGVKAWTGTEPGVCSTVDAEIVPTNAPQHGRAGCLLLQIPGDPP